MAEDYFTMSDCYDEEGNFYPEILENAIMDGEYVPGDRSEDFLLASLRANMDDAIYDEYSPEDW